MYHGTTKSFDKFDDFKKGENTQATNSKLGHFFARSKEDVAAFKNTLKKEGKDRSEEDQLTRRPRASEDHASTIAFVFLKFVSLVTLANSSEYYELKTL